MTVLNLKCAMANPECNLCGWIQPETANISSGHISATFNGVSLCYRGVSIGVEPVTVNSEAVYISAEVGKIGISCRHHSRTQVLRSLGRMRKGLEDFAGLLRFVRVCGTQISLRRRRHSSLTCWGICYLCVCMCQLLLTLVVYLFFLLVRSFLAARVKRTRIVFQIDHVDPLESSRRVFDNKMLLLHDVCKVKNPGKRT